MSGGFNNPIVGGGGGLVYPSIHSPNYVANVSGWTINKDGSAEFDNLTIRGDFVIEGAHGSFAYDASGNLVSAMVGQNTTDPIHSLTCYAGIGTFESGFVVTLLSTANAAFFQYEAPSGSQGALILSVASASGVDPVTSSSYTAGMQGVDPVFGDFLRAVGANLDLGIGGVFGRSGHISVQQGSGASSPYIVVDAPEQTTTSHVELLIQGESPDGSHAGQLLIGRTSGGTVLTPETDELLEVQGNVSAQGGILAYKSTPAAGALLATLLATSDTDKYGNVANAGLNVGTWPTSPAGSPAQHFGVDNLGQIYLCDTTGATRIFGSGEAAASAAVNIQVRDSSGHDQAVISDIAGSQGGTSWVAGFNGPVTAWHPGSSPPTTETVQTITSGFPTGITGTISYWMSPLQEGIVFVFYNLSIALSTTLTAGTTTITSGGIASAYRPATSQILNPTLIPFNATAYTPELVSINTGGSMVWRGATVTTPSGGVSQLIGLCSYQTKI